MEERHHGKDATSLMKWNLRPQESQDGSPLQLLLSEDVFT